MRDSATKILRLQMDVKAKLNTKIGDERDDRK